MWKQETSGSFLMDICLRDSCLTWHCWQKNFCSDPNLSGLVKRSKHPIRVDVPQFWLKFMWSASPLQEWLDFVDTIFADPPWFGSRSSDMSTHGSYVVDVKPQAIHITSDRRIPENTLWATQQSPLPALQKKWWWERVIKKQEKKRHLSYNRNESCLLNKKIKKRETNRVPVCNLYIQKKQCCWKHSKRSSSKHNTTILDEFIQYYSSCWKSLCYKWRMCCDLCNQ